MFAYSVRPLQKERRPTRLTMAKTRCSLGENEYMHKYNQVTFKTVANTQLLSLFPMLSKEFTLCVFKDIIHFSSVVSD